MKYFTKLFLAFILLLTVQSCSNDDDGQTTALIFTPEVAIANSETLTYDLGAFGHAELTNIVFQAENASVSELREDPDTGEIFYFYRPQSDFIGRDYVEIRTESGPIGSPDSKTIMRAKINIQVSF